MITQTRRMLVVDGDSEIRDVVEDLLFGHGFAVHQAADAMQAVREMRENDFDVLLCHFILLAPVRDQLSQSDPALQPPPRVVSMSASGSHAPSDQASANLSKPFTRRQLLKALRGR